MPNSQFIGTDLTGQLDGLHAPHYFNGRLLTAEDLQADQLAVLTRQAWLGKASGYGVIEGLMVTQAGPTSVTITAGMGLNRQGEIIRLPNDITLPLIPQATNNQPPTDAGRFARCDFQSTGGTSSTPAGAYLLAVMPASHFAGLVQMKAAAGSVMASTSNGSTSSTPGCGSKWEVEGVQFKTIFLTDFDPNSSGVTDNNRRNLLAHWCYGSEHLPDLPLDPFHFNSNFGGLDQIDPADLTPCDLPLAVFYWTGTALSFVDSWSARRRLIRPDALDEVQESAAISRLLFFIGAFAFRSRIVFPFGGSGGITPPERVTQPKTRTWKGIMSDKRVADAQARFLQFQDQIQKFMADGTASTVAAADYFRFFPPVSFLPILLAPLLEILLPPEGPPIEVARRETGERVAPLWMREFATRTTAGAAAAAPEGGAQPQQAVQFIPYLRFLLQQRQILAQELENQGQGNLVNQGTAGFNIATFFSGFQNVNANIALVDGETVDFTLQQSWYDEAIDLNPILSSSSGKTERVPFLNPYLNLYLVAENLMSPYDQPYLMIVKGMRPTVWANLRGQEARSVG